MKYEVVLYTGSGREVDEVMSAEVLRNKPEIAHSER